MRTIRTFLLCPQCARSSVKTLRNFASTSLPASLVDDTAEKEEKSTQQVEYVDDLENGLRLNSNMEQAHNKSDDFTPVFSKTEILWLGERERFNKTYADRKVHVTSVNRGTDERSIVRLSMPDKSKMVAKIVKQSRLPLESLAGLKGALADCNQPPKVLQHNADQVSKMLANRRFPASPTEVKEARKIVMEDIMENDMDVQNELRNPKSAEFIERMVYKKAQKYLSKVRYNWKPLQIEKREEVAAFALSRMAPYFAEMERVLIEFDRSRFVPETVLDYGSGIGAAFWAAHQKWGERIRHYCLVDDNYHMRNFSMDIMRGTNYQGSGEFVNKNVYFRKNLVPSAKNTYDLVILHRTLIEMPSREARLALIEELWKRTNKYLVIVETPLEEGFKAVMEARDFILTAGTQFDFDVAKEALDQIAKLDMKMVHFLANKRISDYEKLCVVQEKLGQDFHIPTKVESGHVFAPCPHDQGCPKLSKWFNKVQPCHFHVRWTEQRADHKTESWMRDGTLTGKFSYMIMAKGERPAFVDSDGKILEHAPRILRRTEGHGCSTCTVCTPNDGIQQFTVSKRAKNVFRRVIAAHESQLLPVDYKVVKSSSDTSEIVRALLEEKE